MYISFLEPMYIHKPPGPYIHTPYMHTYVHTYTHTCIRSFWGASEALWGLGRHGQWLRNVLGKPRVHGESWGMFEIFWVGSRMDGEVRRRFGECTGDVFESTWKLGCLFH